jgi:5,6-dimethylbenzimidazole synthase
VSAHLAAAALGYNVWWVTAIGREEAQNAMKPLLGIPNDMWIRQGVAFKPYSYSGFEKSFSNCGRR